MAKCIIPCAGLGTRMNMKPGEAKELLLDPVYKTPLIDYSLKICKDYSITPVIISRPEKKEFNRYVAGKCELLVIEPRGEWMDTILQSRDMWHDEKNILILPDTRFSPKKEVLNLLNDLDKYDLSFGLHNVKEDYKKWGMVRQTATHSFEVCEKPTEDKFTSEAWGLVSFKPQAGEKLFTGFSQKGVWFKVENACCTRLTSFGDITRSGRIDKYEP